MSTEDTTGQLREQIDTATIRGAFRRTDPLPNSIGERLCDEIDRLRAALAFHVANTTTGGGASARLPTHDFRPATSGGEYCADCGLSRSVLTHGFLKVTP